MVPLVVCGCCCVCGVAVSGVLSNVGDTVAVSVCVCCVCVVVVLCVVSVVCLRSLLCCLCL